MEKNFEKSKIYYIESKEDPNALVGIEVELLHEGKALSWFDTTKRRMIDVAKIEEKENEVAVTDNIGRTYNFSPMTLEIYNDTVKQKLFSPSEFTNEEDMVKAFKKTLESEY